MERIGKYEVIRELGRGSMGRVFLARHPIMDKTVAIKVVHAPELSGAPEIDHLRRRLFAEARGAGLLSHANIIAIHDVDVVGELAFIVMEYIEGDTLEDRLASGAPMSVNETASIVGQIACALDAAHARAIIHRDIKPANIMLSHGNRVKVADFGIARNLAEAGLTKTGLVLGTPYYMAPEQILGHPIDGRADQFALAVIAYRMLTGVRPFDGDTVTAIMYQIVNGEPKPMLERNKALTRPIADVVARALSKDPNGRYATCSEFALELLRASAPRPAPAPIAGGAGAAAVMAPAPVAAPTATATPKQSPWRAGLQVIFYIGLSLAVIAFVITLYVRERPAAPQAPQPAPVVQSEPQPPVRRPEARKPARRRDLKRPVNKEEPAAPVTEPATRVDAPLPAGQRVGDPGPGGKP
ncbi:MAG TPA: serine/threonine-protein kinase [Bryobacteraceae bacterium]|nr:serine/threonine-protein kinase [Bryobacteraceae bacterium]